MIKPISKSKEAERREETPLKKRLIVLLMVSITVSTLLSGCNAAKAQPGSKLSSKDLLRTSEEGEVAFNVTFANPLGQQKVGYLSFIVTLSTHSVDLPSYPLNQYAKLYDYEGNLLAAQSVWETEGDNHHLVGKLHFKTKQDLENVDGLKLVVLNFGGAAKREFTWD